MEGFSGITDPVYQDARGFNKKWDVKLRSQLRNTFLFLVTGIPMKGRVKYSSDNLSWQVNMMVVHTLIDLSGTYLWLTSLEAPWYPCLQKKRISLTI
jgi:hypothetical protein